MIMTMNGNIRNKNYVCWTLKYLKNAKRDKKSRTYKKSKFWRISKHKKLDSVKVSKVKNLFLLEIMLKLPLVSGFKF